MKPPLRIVRNIITLLSVSLCLLSIVLWIRSYFVEDTWHRTGNEGWEYIKISGGAISYYLHQYIDSNEPWKHEQWRYTGWRQRQGFWSQFGLHANYTGDAHLCHASISFAILTLITASVPVSRLIRWRKSRRPAGHCPRCGYDLRATPNRCPECGLTPIFELTRHA